MLVTVALAAGALLWLRIAPQGRRAIARHSDEAAAVLRAISPERVLAAAEPFLPPSQP